MNKKKLIKLLLIGCCAHSFATSIESKVTLGKPISCEVKASDVISSHNASTINVVNGKFSIESNASLSMELLDKCWDKRENLANQKIIAKYLMSQPKVPSKGLDAFEIAWKTARLVYFIGNYGYGEKAFVDTKNGVTLFNYGAEAGKVAYQIEPSKVEGYYWYAIDLGSYGLAKGILSAAANAGAGMDALKKAKEIDPTYHWSGSSRILGRYYQELPGIFGGSNKKALELFKYATEKSPEFDNNWLFLGRFYMNDGDYKKALSSCTKALDTTAIDGRFEEARYKREAKECIAKAQSKLS